jgi:hypothetical protein
MTRRGFLRGMLSALAAPAIVHAGNLMPVKALDPILFSQNPWWNPTAPWNAELTAVTRARQAFIRQAFIPRLHVQLYQVTPLHDLIASSALPDWPEDESLFTGVFAG